MGKTIEQKFGTDKKLFLIITVSFEKQDEIRYQVSLVVMLEFFKQMVYI